MKKTAAISLVFVITAGILVFAGTKNISQASGMGNSAQEKAYLNEGMPAEIASHGDEIPDLIGQVSNTQGAGFMNETGVEIIDISNSIHCFNRYYTVEDLVIESDLILIGRVESTILNATNHHQFNTTADIVVDEILKGSLMADTFTIELHGALMTSEQYLELSDENHLLKESFSTYGDSALKAKEGMSYFSYSINGAEYPVKGDTVLLFLETGSKGMVSRVLGGSYFGSFKLNEETGTFYRSIEQGRDTVSVELWELKALIEQMEAVSQYFNENPVKLVTVSIDKEQDKKEIERDNVFEKY